MVKPHELSFDTVCKLLDKLLITKKHVDKVKWLKRFTSLNIERDSRDAFSVFRLILPALDEKRGNYKLLEQKLIDVLIKACNWDPKKTEDAIKIKNWKKPWKKGDAAGDLAKTLEEDMFASVCFVAGGSPEARQLKVYQLNQKLDDLVAAQGKSQEQARILAWLMNHTTHRQMRWIVHIILKNMRLGISEGTIFKAWHPEAQDFYNNSGMSLEAVFNQMTDLGKMYNKSIQPGKVVRPQLAQATFSARSAFNKMHKKEKGVRGRGGVHTGILRPFVIETKFDGERIQVHCCGSEGGTGKPKLAYFSRAAIDHGERSSYNVLDELFRTQVRAERYILDGELLVWNIRKRMFEPFGGLKAVVNAAVNGKDPEELLEIRDWDGGALADSPDYDVPRIKECELVYVAFDVLYLGEAPVTHKPLEERYRLLKESINTEQPCIQLPGTSGVCARLVPMVPEETIFGSVPACSRATSEQEIEEKLKLMERLGEEGILVKALDAPWIPDDRSNWLKIKPEYIRSVDIDAVVIGGWWGERQRGCMVSQYLLALYDKTTATWVSFGRVGSGFTNEERERFYDSLKDNLSDDVDAVPRLYQVTGREKPDVWVIDPLKSVVLEIQADLRTIISRTYKTQHSLRFPRIVGHRWDKGPRDATSVEELDSMIAERKQWMEQALSSEERAAEGQQQQGDQAADGAGHKGQAVEGSPGPSRRSAAKRRATAQGGRRGGAKRQLHVVEAFRPPDMPQVRLESSVLVGSLVYFAGYGGMTKSQAAELVARLGGRVSAAWSPRVTCILAGPRDTSYLVRTHIAQDRDIISTEWLQQCAVLGRRVPPRPKHYIHISVATREMSTDMDQYGDSYLSDVDAQDVQLLLSDRMREFKLAPADLAEVLDPGQDSEGEMRGPQGAAKVFHREGKHCFWGGALPNAEDLLLYLDSELAGQGLLDSRFSLLRGSRIALLEISPPSIGLSSHEALEGQLGLHQRSTNCTADRFLDVVRLLTTVNELSRQLNGLQKRQLAAEAQLHGAEVSSEVREGVTHLVCLVGDEAPDTSPAALLEAVTKQGGGPPAVAALKKGLEQGEISLVTTGWLEESFFVLKQDPLTAQKASEEDHLLNLEEATRLLHWPWGDYLPATTSANKRRRGKAASQLLSNAGPRATSSLRQGSFFDNSLAKQLPTSTAGTHLERHEGTMQTTVHFETHGVPSRGTCNQTVKDEEAGHKEWEPGHLKLESPAAVSIANKPLKNQTCSTLAPSLSTHDGPQPSGSDLLHQVVVQPEIAGAAEGTPSMFDIIFGIENKPENSAAAIVEVNTASTKELSAASSVETRGHAAPFCATQSTPGDSFAEQRERSSTLTAKLLQTSNAD